MVSKVMPNYFTPKGGIKKKVYHLSFLGRGQEDKGIQNPINLPT